MIIFLPERTRTIKLLIFPILEQVTYKTKLDGLRCHDYLKWICIFQSIHATFTTTEWSASQISTVIYRAQVVKTIPGLRGMIPTYEAKVSLLVLET